MFLLKSKILKKEKGASAVEFALILAPLIVLIFAIFQFGIIFNNWIALTHAAREGVRLAAVGEDEEFIIDEIIKRAPSVKIDEANIEFTNLGGDVGEFVTVTVPGEQFNLGYPVFSLKGKVLTSSATLRIEYEK